MAETVPIVMVLQKQQRNDRGLQQAAEAAAALGLEVSASGRATLSCRVPLPTFRALFGVEPKELSELPPGTRDHGRPGGFTSSESLAIPTPLAPFVQSIEVSPPATRL